MLVSCLKLGLRWERKYWPMFPVILWRKSTQTKSPSVDKDVFFGYSLYFNTLVSFRCIAKLFYSDNAFPWRHASLPWDMLRAYTKSLCCFGKSGSTRSGTLAMNFKKSNKQTFLWSLGFNFFSVKVKEKCLTYVKEFVVFGNMPCCRRTQW